MMLLGRSEGVVEVALPLVHRVVRPCAPTWALPVAHAHGIISPHTHLVQLQMQNTNVMSNSVRSKKNVTRQNG